MQFTEKEIERARNVYANNTRNGLIIGKRLDNEFAGFCAILYMDKNCFKNFKFRKSVFLNIWRTGRYIDAIKRFFTVFPEWNTKVGDMAFCQCSEPVFYIKRDKKAIGLSVFKDTLVYKTVNHENIIELFGECVEEKYLKYIESEFYNKYVIEGIS